MSLPYSNFEMFAGDTRTLTVTVRDAATGEIVDLTGATVSWALGDKPGGTTEVTKTTSDGIAVSSPTTGVFVVTIDPDDTSDLSGRHYHEAEVTDSSSRVVTVMRGWATILPDLA